MHLFLIRHGQSLVNLTDWEHGNTDEGLTDLGQRQAKAVARRLADEQADVLYASTMLRARETAAVVAETIGLEVRYDDRIREIGNNKLDHAPWPDLPIDYADYWATARPFASTTPAVEQGESYMHFRTRVGAFVEDVQHAHAGQTVLAVAHGGVVDAVFDHVFNVGPWRRCQIWTSNAAITHLEALDPDVGETEAAEIGPEQWRLHRHNCSAHLQGLESEPVVIQDATGPTSQP
jgi:broad specificity phosphatase PhoE